MKDMIGLMKQAQAMQQKMQDLQADVENVTVEGRAGGGMVRVTDARKKTPAEALPYPTFLPADGEALPAEIMAPQVHIYCKPITARPPVVLPVYSDEFWTKWFPGARSRDLARFETLAKRGRPWNKPHLMADLPEVRDKYMDALKIQQMAHMEQSLQYCRKELNLGVRWRA